MGRKLIFTPNPTRRKPSKIAEYHSDTARLFRQSLADELEEACRPPSWDHIIPANRDLLVYIVPRHPDNRNPLLSLALQKNLDDLSPHEFLTYIMTRLTLEERESLMVDEWQRRRTFLVSWPHSTNGSLSGIAMAKAGFYAMDSQDKVQCVFCRGSLLDWNEGDVPLAEHAKAFVFCRFVKGLHCGNKEYVSDALREEDMLNIIVHPRRNGNESGAAGTCERAPLGISAARPDTIRHAPYASRLRTYSRWPTTSGITDQALCEAGFYFTGFDDQVKCFCCSGGLRDWHENDDPWVEHARWFPDCAFLTQTKGEQFIEQVHESTPSHKKCSTLTQAERASRAEIRKVKSEQEEMNSICCKLGHTVEAINQAVARNGKPFSDIKQMIDAVYAVEACRQVDARPLSPDRTSQGAASSRAVMPEEDRLRNYADQAPQGRPGVFDRVEQETKYPQGCRNCERKTNQFVSANHIGLPCGHLIYCDACAGEARTKADRPENCVVCPYYQCRSQLSGTMKVYFS